MASESGRVGGVLAAADITGDERHDRIAQASIVTIVLHDQGRSDFAGAAIRIRKIDNNDIAALHCLYFW